VARALLLNQPQPAAMNEAKRENGFLMHRTDKISLRTLTRQGTNAPPQPRFATATVRWRLFPSWAQSVRAVWPSTVTTWTPPSLRSECRGG
jgi:hypothetical protein